VKPELPTSFVGRLISAALLSAFFATACAQKPAPLPEPSPRPVIVFVHGAWGGGWQYRKVEPLLEEAGYKVYRPTLTGLGERVHLARPDVDLSTHIEDIVNVFEFEDLHDVILVGHSYGGMVISGVADRLPERIAKLVYVDAILPENGESVESLFGTAIERMAVAGGGGAEPWQLVPRWVEPGKPPPVDVPQPIRTFTEPIALGNPAAAVIPSTYLLTVEPGATDDEFARFADRARARGWPVMVMEGGHNPYWFQPEAFVRVLLDIVQEQSATVEPAQAS
jgi:pimeloyl-ACP methyl ester carboxylesterase